MNETGQNSVLAQAISSGMQGQGQAQTPRAPTNLEEAIQKAHRMIEMHSEIIGRASNMIDRINGPRPEKDTVGQEVGGASGQLSELHRLLDIMEMQTREICNNIETLDCTI